MIRLDFLIPEKKKEDPKSIKQTAVSGDNRPGCAVPLATRVSLKKNSSIPALKSNIYSSNVTVPVRIMITEKRGTMVLAKESAFSLVKMRRISPDNIKQMAVLAFMLIQTGEMLLRMGISPIHPISTIRPTDTTIILKTTDSFSSFDVSFGW